MAFYQYIHGARGYAGITTIGIAAGSNGQYANKTLAVVPIAAGLALDENFDYVPVHEGFRELYVQVAGTRLGTWSFRGIVLDIASDSNLLDAFTATNVLVCESLMQSTNTSYAQTAPLYGVNVQLSDGSHVVQFAGIVLTATLSAPIEGVLSIEFTGIAIPETVTIYKPGKITTANLPVHSATAKAYIRSASGRISLFRGSNLLAPLMPLSFDVTVAREAQVVYCYGDPDNQRIVDNEEFAYGDVYGSRRFTLPVVVSQGISSVGCTMLTESKILQRGVVDTSTGSLQANTFVENTNATNGVLYPGSSSQVIYEPATVKVEWRSQLQSSKYYRCYIYNCILVGKRMFQLNRPRVPYLITARPVALSPVAGTEDRKYSSLAKFAFES